jgi:beta-mannosidase
MPSYTLSGRWTLTYGPQDGQAPATPQALRASAWPTIPATVPGNVELDLMAAGKLPELSVGTNIHLLRGLEGHRWWYRRSFPSPALRPGQAAFLNFEGLDCLGVVYLNDQPVGVTDNMLIAHQFDVTALLRAGGDNQLAVRIDSAVRAGRAHAPAVGELASGVNWESLAIRKAPHMYGWDIMPRLVSAGLWRDVTLGVVDATRFRDTYWATLAADPDRRTAALLVDWDFTTDQLDLDAWRVGVTLRRQGRARHQSEYAVLGTHGRVKLELTDVDCWFPRGAGEAALYEAAIELRAGDGTVLDRREAAVGLRTVELRRTDVTSPQQPGEFTFVVNGRQVFIKGTNWVPLDALHSRDRQHLPGAVAMLVDLHCNMIRCWGGNVYEDHALFDLCDREGIMVWQDFAMACALYPQTDEFAGHIRREAEAVVAKLRNHPSLVLWAGDNEIDEAYSWAGLSQDPNTNRLSRQVLPEVVRRLDPLRPYLPSSPYRSPALVAAGNNWLLKPEDHLWGPRDDFKGAYYTTSPCHFASEIGYHGCPDRASLEQMMDPEHLWPWQENEQWLTHAVRPHPNFTDYDYRIPLMANQIAVLFGQTPQTLDDFVAASQASQAEALKFFIEWFRQAKFRRTGLIWWNLRDGWPIISDAVVDYYNRKKLAYHYIRRSQADVCPLCAQPQDGRHALLVVNDTFTPVSGRLQVTDGDTGLTLFDGPCQVESNGKSIAGALPAPSKPTLWLLAWESAGTTALNHYVAGPRPFDLRTYRGWITKMGLAR